MTLLEILQFLVIVVGALIATCGILGIGLFFLLAHTVCQGENHASYGVLIRGPE